MTRRAAIASVAAALVAAAAVALASWVGQTAFLRWALDYAVAASDGRLKVDGISGTLFDGLAIGRLEWTEKTLPGERVGLSVTVRELRVDASPWRLLQREVAITQASASEVRVFLPASDEPASPPADLRLPLAVRIDALRVASLSIEAQGATAQQLNAIALRGQYRPAARDAAGTQGTEPAGEQAGERSGSYTIEALEFASVHGTATLRGTLSDTAPFALDAGADAVAAWRSLPLRARAVGALDAFELTVQAGAATPAASRPSTASAPSAAAPAAPPASPSARAGTRIRPFAPDLLGPVDLAFEGVTADWAGLPPGWSGLFDGTARLRPGVGQQGQLVADGEIRLRNALPGSIDRQRLPVAAAEAELRWDGARLHVQRLDVSAPGSGRAGGTAVYDPAAVQLLFGRTLPQVALDLRLEAIDLSVIDGRLPGSRVSGSVRLDGRTLAVSLADAARGGARLEAMARVDDTRLMIERALVAALPGVADGALSLSGAIGLEAPYTARIEATFDRVDPAGLIALPGSLGVADARPAPAALRGSLDGDLLLQGPLRFGPGDEPAELSLNVVRGRMAGQAVSLRLRALLNRDRAREVAVSFAAGDTRFDAGGALGVAGDVLRFRLRAPSLAPMAALSSVDGVTGELSADGELRGRFDALGLVLQAELGRLDARGSLRARALTVRAELPNLASVLAAVPGGGAPLALRADARDMVVGGMRLERGSLRVDGSEGAHAFSLSADGPRGALHMRGTAGLTRATEAGDAIKWRATVAELRSEGDLEARLSRPVRLEAAAGAFAIEPMTIGSDFGTLNVPYARWRDGRFAFAGDLSVAPTRPGRLRRLLEAFGPLPPDATSGFDPDDLRLQAQADLSGSSLTDLTGTLRLQMGAAGKLDATGDARIELNEGRLSGPLELAIPSLAFANRLIGPAWTIDGRLRFSGRVGGSVNAPRLDGSLTGADLRLHQAAMGWRLHGGTLSGRFDGEHFRLDSLKLNTGQPASGSVELAGDLRLGDRQGAFTMKADRLAVPIGPGQRVVMSGQADLTSRGGAFELKGQLRADEGLIELRGGDAPTLPADVVIAGRAGDAGGGREGNEGEQRRDDVGAASPAAATAVSPADEQRVRLSADIAVDLGEQLRVRGSGIDARLTGKLSLRGTLPDAPRAYGTVRIRDGRYTAYGRQLEITTGRVVFNGAIDNPQLDIVALRRNQPVEAGVALTGTVLSPRVRLTSRPEVPDSEKLSWLVLGMPLENAHTGAEAAALQAAAATLFGSNDGGLSGSIAQAFGLDSISMRSASASSGLTSSEFGGTGYGTSLPPIPGQVGVPRASATGAGAVGENVVAVGKRLGSNLYVTYEAGLRGVWNLLRVQYDLTDRLSLRAQTGSESALDVLYRYSFD